MILRDDEFERELLDLLDSFIKLNNLRERDPFPEDEWNLYLENNSSQGLKDYLRECEKIDADAKTRGVRV